MNIIKEIFTPPMHLTANDITIPDTFTNTLYRVFGQESHIWLTKLDNLLSKARAKWQLTNCKVANTLSINLICFAQSPDYGAVVLKIGVPNPEFNTEITALSLYRGKDVCTCYDSDTDLGAILLERIVPGYNLKAMPEKICLEIAANIIPNLSVPLQPPPLYLISPIGCGRHSPECVQKTRSAKKCYFLWDKRNAYTNKSPPQNQPKSFFMVTYTTKTSSIAKMVAGKS